jgi:hypothetical protein
MNALWACRPVARDRGLVTSLVAVQSARGILGTLPQLTVAWTAAAAPHDCISAGAFRCARLAVGRSHLPISIDDGYVLGHRFKV